ncbi:YolD-like family protein [Bacillus infantis]|uniref:YolD-like family protein n=1 Tax=Bacillus infantis TaxID=324767 RepID=UPI00215594B7|nr:YolD-like family protein [Bacillus infantis]MCR6610577.1 YolD-like family protein [Bacillus infantis]
MIRDRGKLKWQPAHSMPEHRRMLQQLSFDSKKQNKPVLDEQEFEEIGYIIMDSLNYAILIRITIWKDGFFEAITGIVDKVEELMKYILFETASDIRKLFIEDIIRAESL